MSTKGEKSIVPVLGRTLRIGCKTGSVIREIAKITADTTRL